MKKSFMTRVLAVSLSAAMAFSMSSASNLMTASAASTVNLKTTFKTLKVNQTYKMTLKKNTLNWKITKVTTTNKKICTVYGKTASSVMLKGKGVGRAKITVKVKTTKRKYPKNIKNMKCTVNVKAAGPSAEDVAFSATAAANSNTEVRVNFTKAVDAAAVENFKIAEENVSVSKAELSEDKKSVLLTIAGAEYSKNYNLTVTGIKVGGTVQADQKLTFTTPSPEVLNPTTLTAERAILKSDGQDATTITFKITDKDGKPLTDKGMEVRFTTNLGKFATDRVSIQNGEAKVMYTSEALSENHTAVITATIIEAPADTKLIGTTATTSVTLMPNPDQIDDTSIGATLTSITAPTADRIYAYFNKEVRAEDFKIKDQPNTKKFAADIKSGLDNGYGESASVQSHNIVGILPVENDNTALQLLVDKPMVDNSIIKVEFENKTQTNGIYIPKNTAYCKLTDARQPAVVSVNTPDQRTIEIEFSEAVLPDELCGWGDKKYDKDTQAIFAANNLDNYQIDGIQLSNEKYWGKIVPGRDSEGSTSGTDAGSSLKLLSEKILDEDNSKDGSIKVGAYGKRNVVTIKLSRERYLAPGSHRISVANVGDWAAKTDKERNIVSTEGFDFEVSADTSAPTFTATAMSPEQYLLEFSSDIVSTDGNNILTTDSEQFESVIKLEAKSSNGTWSEISNGSGKGSGKNAIQVSQVKEGDTLTNKYLVEVKADWTDVYNTSSTRDNYYRHAYRLTIAADKIQNAVNGIKNSALSVELTDDIMKTSDAKSPEIEKIEDAEGNIGSYNVYMTEPVKLSASANKEGLTPNQTQQSGSSTNMGVPAPEAQFVHVGDGRTVEGIIEDNVFVDAYDQIINVVPESELGNGKWDLIVRSISDDIGNTAPTLTKRISIDNPVTETNFRVVWAAVGYNPGAYYKYDDERNVDYGRAIKDAANSGKGNCIYVKFNKPVTLFGTSTNAQSISNYTLNGSPLPTGTEIRAHIKGYDEGVGMDTVVTDSVTIVLPQDRFSSNGLYLVSSLNTMLNISKTVTCSTTNELLDNGGMVRIPFQIGSGNSNDKYTTTGNTDLVPFISSLDAKTDAVWGNAASEQFGTGTDNIKNIQEYYEKFKAALEDEKYRKVVLNTSLNLTNTEDKDMVNVFGRSGTLTIKRAVDLDLNGNDIIGNVVVTTDNVADDMYIYSSGKQSTITGKNEKDSALTVNAGKIKEFWLQNVEVARPNINNGSEWTAVSLNDVWVNSFVLYGDTVINGNINVTDANGFGLKNESAKGAEAIKGNINIQGTGKANLSGDFTSQIINVNQGAEVYLAGSKLGKDSKIVVNSSAAKLFLDTLDLAADKPTILAAAKDVQIYVSNNVSVNDISFEKNSGCGIVEIDDKGKKKDTNVFTDVVVLSPIAYALDNVRILPEDLPIAAGDATKNNAVITTGAITGAGIDVTNTIRDQSQSLKDSKGDAVNVEKKEDIKVTVSVNSAKLVTVSNGVIKTKAGYEDATTDTVDEIRVTIELYGQKCIRTIKVRKA